MLALASFHSCFCHMLPSISASENGQIFPVTWEILIHLHFFLVLFYHSGAFDWGSQDYFFAFEMSRVQGRSLQCHILAICLGYISAQGSRYKVKGTQSYQSSFFLYSCSCVVKVQIRTSLEICQQLKSSFGFWNNSSRFQSLWAYSRALEKCISPRQKYNLMCF